MNLAPKASAGLLCRTARAEAGYAMAALLVGLAVMAVVLGAAMPTWSHMVRREKEEELIFRGLQYARAINQYQRKFANASPQSLDVLIEQRLLRKKFRDPMATDEKGEFQMLYLSSRAGGPQGTAPNARGAGSGTGATGTGTTGTTGTGTGSTYSTTPSGGIVGVASKNTGTSIKIYKEKTRYNEWQFVGMEMSQQAGRGGGSAGGPQRGCPDGSPGRSVTRGGSTFTECGPGGNRGGGGGDGGFGGGGFGGRGGADRGRGTGPGGGRNPSPQR
jgi:type II secretory pathway pseudopilin PulG